MSDKPNILFLSLDAFRADRAGFLGYGRPTTPNLDRLSRRALVCSQAVSIATFTQASVVGLFTSTRPLSHGGYDHGGAGRPPTLFKAFHDSGWDVSLLSSFKWITRFFGYGEGVDHEYHFFSPKDLVGASVNRMKSTLQAHHAGTIAPDGMVAAVRPVIEDLFVQLEHYCADRVRDHDADAADFAGTRLVTDGWNYDRLMDSVERHKAEFRRDPVAYVDRHLHYIPKSHQWIAADWRLARKPAKLAAEAIDKAVNWAVERMDPRTARLRRHRDKPFPDGAALANRLIRHLREKAADPDSPPFLLYTHFLDTHVPYYPGRARNWYREAPRYLRALGYDPDGIDIAAVTYPRPRDAADLEAWRALYDAALLYTDEQIGRVLDELERLGLAENTLIVVCGDHGEELGEHGNISHYFRLHDHNCRVPLIFAGPGVEPGRTDRLATVLDIAPTLAALARVAAPAGWQGRPVGDSEVLGRDHVVLETFYGGNCLFDRRPLYMAVRTRTHKYIWKEFMDPDDRFGPDGHELYDLVADPYEQVNLYRPDHPMVPGFERLIAQRLRQIPEVAAERIRPLERETA